MSARIHLRNLFLNWGGHATTLIVLFFLSPYIVGKLDGVSYGIWSLVNVLTGYMGIFDLGVRASVGRHVALYLGKKDMVGVDETIRAGFGFFSLTGILILIVGILLGWLFPTLFQGVPSEHHDTVRLLLPFMVINIWLSAIAAIYSSVIVSYDRFDIARGVDMLVLFVRTVGTIASLQIGLGLWGLAYSLIVGNAFAIVLNRIYAGRIHKGLRSFPFLFSRLRLKELFCYGIPAFITQTSVKIIGQSDLVIVGILLGVSEVREYSIGAMLVYYSATFLSIIGKSFFPTIQRAVSGGTIGEVKYLFFNQLRITLCFGFLVYIGMVFYSKPFIYLWMFQDGFDTNSVSSAAIIMSILALSKLPILYIQPCQNVLAALGFVGITARLSIIEALVNLILSFSFVLLFKFGIAGVAAGTLVSRMAVSSLYIPYCLCNKLKIKWYHFIKAVVLPGIFSGAIFAFACFLLLRFWIPDTWLTFSFHIAFAILLWIFIVYFLLLSSDTRHRINQNFVKNLNNLKRMSSK
ncbi:MAG: polysaccharide biosynthesis protein [Desulfobacula sp. GWF2_41_7]|nr:MAG: polysaccharide biosynthesis protein [Desulfobacula sp. GWF2_41_7]